MGVCVLGQIEREKKKFKNEEESVLQYVLYQDVKQNKTKIIQNGINKHMPAKMKLKPTTSTKKKIKNTTIQLSL